MGHECNCSQAALTREDALEQAMDFLQQAEKHISEGRAAEASVLNTMAGTAIALADRFPAPVQVAPRVH